MEKKASSFSGQIGFVLAAAGSAVGVGNLWRFPYLAAKDGGGLFLLVYLVLVLTFGFTLLTSDIAIGRRTKQSAIRAYETMRPKWKFLGILTFLVPVLIMTYYAVIGGWITKYAAVYLTGQSAAAAEDGYFTSFITSPVSPVVFALLFMGVTAFIVYNGVEGGIERVSRYMMPILLVLVVVIAGYALTLRHEDASGQMRTGLEGLRYYLTPHMEGLTVSRFLQILLDAMSQLFFSLSVSMGIMITYGSYVKPDVDLNKAVNQIEIFDTGVAPAGRCHDHPRRVCFLWHRGHERRPQPDVRLAAQGIQRHGQGGRVRGHPVLCHRHFCHPDLLHLGAGIHHRQLHGDLPLGPQKDGACAGGHLSGRFRHHCAGLQHLLF